MRPPIADPFAPPNPFPAEETRVFAQSFWRTYFGTLGAMVIFAAVFALYFVWRFGGAFLSQQGFFLLLMLGINPLSAAFGARFRPLKVTRHGVQGPPLVGFIEWERMKAARFLWIGFSYARVSLRRHFSALWIPLTLRDPQSFARTLEEWAPADNPLRLLMQNGSSKL